MEQFATKIQEYKDQKSLGSPVWIFFERISVKDESRCLICKKKRTHTHTQTKTHKHARAHIHMHVGTHVHTHACMRAHTHAHAQKRAGINQRFNCPLNFFLFI